MEAENLAKKYDVDLSDALQIVTVRDGQFKNSARESKTVLATADGGLVKAAKNEDLWFWNVIECPIHRSRRVGTKIHSSRKLPIKCHT